MAQETNIVAEPRTVHGSSAARRLRRSGLVPAVLATTGGETELLQLNAHDFEREVARHSNPQFIAHIACGGSVRTALVRELQRNGITGRIEHADFGEIDRCVKGGYPKNTEWYAAFGLTFTVIWLYMKILDLLMRVVSQKNSK